MDSETSSLQHAGRFSADGTARINPESGASRMQNPSSVHAAAASAQRSGKINTPAEKWRSGVTAGKGSPGFLPGNRLQVRVGTCQHQKLKKSKFASPFTYRVDAGK